MNRPSKFIKAEELLRVYFTIIINENNSLRILYLSKMARKYLPQWTTFKEEGHI